MFCRKCGATIISEAKFCAECGSPVVVPPVAPVMEAPIVEAPVMEAPVVEIPVVEAPVVAAPVVETPVVEAPVVETPVVEPPVVEAPKFEIPPVEEILPMAEAVEPLVYNPELRQPAEPAIEPPVAPAPQNAAAPQRPAPQNAAPQYQNAPVYQAPAAPAYGQSVVQGYGPGYHQGAYGQPVAGYTQPGYGYANGPVYGAPVAQSYAQPAAPVYAAPVYAPPAAPTSAGYAQGQLNAPAAAKSVSALAVIGATLALVALFLELMANTNASMVKIITSIIPNLKYLDRMGDYAIVMIGQISIYTMCIVCAVAVFICACAKKKCRVWAILGMLFIIGLIVFSIVISLEMYDSFVKINGKFFLDLLKSLGVGYWMYLGGMLLATIGGGKR